MPKKIRFQAQIIAECETEHQKETLQEVLEATIEVLNNYYKTWTVEMKVSKLLPTK